MIFAVAENHPCTTATCGNTVCPQGCSHQNHCVISQISRFVRSRSDILRYGLLPVRGGSCSL